MKFDEVKLTNMQELFLLLHIDRLDKVKNNCIIENKCINCPINPPYSNKGKVLCESKINLRKLTGIIKCSDAFKFLGEYLKAKYHLK